jgi:hypothetical protein
VEPPLCRRSRPEVIDSAGLFSFCDCCSSSRMPGPSRSKGILEPVLSILKYFRKKLLEKNGSFDSNYYLLSSNMNRNICFREESRFYRVFKKKVIFIEKLTKIAISSDLDIDT